MREKHVLGSDFISKELLEKAWKEYTKGWKAEDWKMAEESMSCTSTMDEFAQCEFYDRSVMEELLTLEEIKAWETIVSDNSMKRGRI